MGGGVHFLWFYQSLHSSPLWLLGFCFLAYRWLTPFACNWDSLLIDLSWVFLPGTRTKCRYPHPVFHAPLHVLSSVTQPCSSSSLPVEASAHLMLWPLSLSCCSLYFTSRSHGSDFIPLLRFCLDAALAMETEFLFHLPRFGTCKVLHIEVDHWPCVIVICSCVIILILPLFIDFKLKLNFAKIRCQDVKRYLLTIWSMVHGVEWTLYKDSQLN